MHGYDLLILEEDYNCISQIIEVLLKETKAKVVFLVHKNGQNIATAGDDHNIDKTSFASLVAGNVAATGGLAELLGEEEFSILFHEGKRDSIHINIILNRIILVVIFSDNTNLGLVRLWVKKATIGLAKLFQEIENKEVQKRVLNDSDDLLDDSDKKIDSLRK
jgi:predicted regulator of Ras-like GTPase activity (Roadblock/LC7/MglB family)